MSTEEQWTMPKIRQGPLSDIDYDPGPKDLFQEKLVT
jgi:hypothetical protein